jgi:hypothetical protein
MLCVSGKKKYFNFFQFFLVAPVAHLDAHVAHLVAQEMSGKIEK